MMNETLYMVYWTDTDNAVDGLASSNLSTALGYAELKRKTGMRFVTMVSENIDHVGKSGVDEVKDGKTPDGVPYTWNKASRIGATKR